METSTTFFLSVTLLVAVAFGVAVLLGFNVFLVFGRGSFSIMNLDSVSLLILNFFPSSLNMNDRNALASGLVVDNHYGRVRELVAT